MASIDQADVKVSLEAGNRDAPHFDLPVDAEHKAKTIKCVVCGSNSKHQLSKWGFTVEAALVTTVCQHGLQSYPCYPFQN
jgi:hypothetical protein